MRCPVLVILRRVFPSPLDFRGNETAAIHFASAGTPFAATETRLASARRPFPAARMALQSAGSLSPPTAIGLRSAGTAFPAPPIDH